MFKKIYLNKKTNLLILKKIVPIFHKNAFSVAEAMIALLIGSLMLGAAAPVITKQIKLNNQINVQEQIITRKIETMTPSGMVSFFDLEKCPTGWTELDANYAGRFPRFTGSFNVTNKIYTPNGVEEKTEKIVINRGTKAEDAIRDITGWYRATDSEGYGFASSAWGTTGGAISQGNKTGTYRTTNASGSGVSKDLYFKSSNSVPVAPENRPRFIGLLGCRKN